MAGDCSRRVAVYEDKETLSRAAAGLLLVEARRAVRAKGGCDLLLSGGETPRRCYQMLREEPLLSAVPWRRLNLFWGDERWVPYQDPRSNYGMVKSELLQHVPLKEEQIHPIPHLSSPRRAALSYDRLLRSRFPAGASFDLAFLGLGGDGHTASLFPGTPALREAERWACEVSAPGQELRRVTVTAPVINRSGVIAFLVSGEDKAAILRQVLEGPYDPQHLPAQLIRAEQGRVLWLVDRDAARLLSRKRSNGSN